MENKFHPMNRVCIMINGPVNVAGHDDKSFNLELLSPVFFWVQNSPKCEKQKWNGNSLLQHPCFI
jgi:hypothetical protein